MFARAALIPLVVAASLAAPSAAQDAAKPHQPKVTAPVLVYQVDPIEPMPLPHSTVNVVLGFTVGVDGRTSGLHVVTSGGPACDASALAALAQYRFRPATIDHQPVSKDLILKVSFNH